MKDVIKQSFNMFLIVILDILIKLRWLKGFSLIEVTPKLGEIFCAGNCWASINFVHPRARKSISKGGRAVSKSQQARSTEVAGPSGMPKTIQQSHSGWVEG